MNITNGKYFIDGVFIQIFELICDSYITYVEKHFGTDAIGVFDGYEKIAKSIKRQRRRLEKKCSGLFFESHMIVPVSK